LESIAEAVPKHAPALTAAAARIKQLSAENQQLRALLKKIEGDLRIIMATVDEEDVSLVEAVQGWLMDALDSGMLEGSNDEGVFDDVLSSGSCQECAQQQASRCTNSPHHSWSILGRFR
jgi:hypothetical protein